ncbi:uncharacterized protein DSM5745_04906 [Aspergillus mulundensis]|uniref:DNA2/NAM7 helicase helicase domain-containing protein n=1 Tax=Aspergillus mulundensis TaxID=1810919 RepID=A0A3D8S4Y5_9EURO|nr:hypothetical protein DSM5745_04906 [Aspergillus mulundensis]RDW81349.1 hypothetical protein DSM5745_04906 [Aspergillus mulundensis]
MDNQQISQPQLHKWFKGPRGRDFPASLLPATRNLSTCHLALNGSLVVALVRFKPDSQQPVIMLRPVKRTDGSRLIFPLQDCILTCGVEGDPREPQLDEWIKKQRSKNSFLQTPEMKRVAVYILKLEEDPVKLWSETPSRDPGWQFLRREMRSGAEFTMWKSYKDKWVSAEQEVMDWMRTLQTHLTYWSPKRKAFWWYRQPQPETLKEGTAGPSPPWLYGQPGSEAGHFIQLTHRSYFIDLHDHRCRLVEASRKEHDVIRRKVNSIYNTDQLHNARFVKSQNCAFYYMELKVYNMDLPETERRALKLPPGTIVRFAVAEAGLRDIDLTSQGVVVELETEADLVLFVQGPVPATSDRVFVVTAIETNILPIDEQIDYLNKVSDVCVFGDSEENARRGFSLRRTVLAHGEELSPESPYYFLLDATNGMSTVPQPVWEERLEYLKTHFKLDSAQEVAFNASVRAIKCGLSLFQGSDGSGRELTSIVIILALACLDISIMIAADSDKGIDDLTSGLARVLRAHPKLQGWVGSLFRLRSRARQMSQIRTQSAISDSSSRELECDVLARHEMHNCAMDYAKDNRENGDCKTFLDLVEADRRQPLHDADYKKLELSYQNICAILLRQAKIVSTTLGNASSPLFRDEFKPGALLCIDANHCTEGQLSIALTIQSLRVVILVGDTKRPRPAVASLSPQYENEGAHYLGHPLLTRLQTRYPCMTLALEKKRDHTDIANLNPSKRLRAAPVRHALPLRPPVPVAPGTKSTLAPLAGTGSAGEKTPVKQKQDVANKPITSQGMPEDQPLPPPPHAPVTPTTGAPLAPWPATSSAEEKTPTERKGDITNKTVASQGTLTETSSTTERAANPGALPDSARLLRIKKAVLRFQKTRRRRVEDELTTGFGCGTNEPLTQEDRVAKEREYNSLKLAEDETTAEIELYEELLKED